MTDDKQPQNSLNDLDNIDPIENDDFAQDMSDTFDSFDETTDDLSFEDDTWDSNEFVDTSFDDISNDTTSKKNEINWFNIGVFGFVGIAAVVIGYDMLFKGRQAPVPMTTQPQQIAQQTSSPPIKEDNNAPELNQNIELPSNGFLSNPDILANEENTKEVEKQTNADQDLFSALKTPPNYEENIEDLLSTLKQPTPPTQNKVEETITNNTQTLPTPADAIADNTNSVDMTLPETAEVEDMNPQVNTTEIIPTDVSEQTLQSDVLPIIESAVIEAPTVTEPNASEPSDETIALRSQVNKLNTQITEMNSRIEELTKELEIEKEKGEEIILAPAPAPTNPAADEKIAKMAKTIATLEKRVATLSKAKSSTKASSRPKVTIAPKPKVIWELRGASPNQAYVAQKGTQNLRTVSTGDSLDGIGRITSIAIENNRWVVRGTSGKIVQ